MLWGSSWVCNRAGWHWLLCWCIPRPHDAILVVTIYHPIWYVTNFHYARHHRWDYLFKKLSSGQWASDYMQATRCRNYCPSVTQWSSTGTVVTNHQTTILVDNMKNTQILNDIKLRQPTNWCNMSPLASNTEIYDTSKRAWPPTP